MHFEYVCFDMWCADKVAVKNIILEKVEGQSSDLFGSAVCIVVTFIIMSLLVADVRNTVTSPQDKSKKKTLKLNSGARRYRKQFLF